MQILNGFQQFHKLQFIHRDIKLENIFINDDVFKIADYGFAIAGAHA